MSQTSITLEEQASQLSENGNVDKHTENFPAASAIRSYMQGITSAAKSSPTALAEDFRQGRESGASIYIQNRVDGKIVARTSKFYLQQFSLGLKERSQILETFGAGNISFFGSNVKVYNFAGTALDWTSQNSSTEYFHASSIIQLYNDLMRGTELVKHNRIAVIRVLNHTIFGYPLQMQVQYSQGADKFASFSLSWVVTKHLLGMPGIVSETQLKSLYDPSWVDVSSEASKLLNNIKDTVSACVNALNIPESSQYYGTDNFLLGKDLTQWQSLASEGKIQDSFKDLHDLLIKKLETPDGEVSPEIAKTFGAEEHQIDTFFSEIDGILISFRGGSYDLSRDNLFKLQTYLQKINDFKDRLITLQQTLQSSWNG